jgi:hypothetical protein
LSGTVTTSYDDPRANPAYGHKDERSLNVVNRLFEASKQSPERRVQGPDAGNLHGQLGDEGDLSLPFLDTTNDEYLMWKYLVE